MIVKKRAGPLLSKISCLGAFCVDAGIYMSEDALKNYCNDLPKLL